MKKIYYLCILLPILNWVCAKNILFLLGMPSKSHHIWNRTLMKALVKEGHNITALSVEPGESSKNLHYIVIDGVYQAMQDASSVIDYDNLADFTQFAMYDWFNFVCNVSLKSEGVRKLRNYPRDKFDLVVHDFTNGQCLLGFVNYFNNPPLISITPFNNPFYTPFITGNPQFPSYVPHGTTTFDEQMSFTERCLNFFYYATEWLYRTYVFMDRENRRAKEFFGKDLVKDLETIEKSTSVALINSDPSFDWVQALMPNVIPVAGLHIQPPTSKNIPEPILSFLNNATGGAIFFSLGTLLQSEHLSPEKLDIFLDAFRKMPQYRVLWKIDTNLTQNVPSNVMMRKWMPQSDILAHPKVRLFITHSGLLSTQEAIYHAVPMLGMPFFIDQHQNLKKAKLAKIALELDYKNLTSELIQSQIQRIITDESFQKHADIISSRFRDHPDSPLDRAVFWVNYVLRHKGASHLKSIAVGMSLKKMYMIDISAFVIVVLFFIFLIFYKVMGMLNSYFMAKAVKTKND